MNTKEFRTALHELDFSVGDLARLFEHLGDDAKPTTIRRRIERWAAGTARVPGEAVAFLNIMLDDPRIARRYRKHVELRP